jgi:UDP-glucuronate 4-epimerase
MKVLVTGAAGFIGYHLCKKCLKNNISFVGIDNLNDYYDKNLKINRVNDLRALSSSINKEFVFEKIDLQDKLSLEDIFKKHKITQVVNLAAQAGVRYSLKNPYAYIESNITGFLNILELSRIFEIEHLLYASSSSVYGGNIKMPFSEDHGVDHPVSMYAVTKRSNELMAHSYSHLFNLPTTGLRFFTVYGPWGRPDMALYLFTKAIIENKPIEVFNHGKMKRDFTYVDDIIEGVSKLINYPPSNKLKKNDISYSPAESWGPFRILNIGNSNPSNLEDYIEAIEKAIGKKAIKKMLPIQPGDVEYTYADTTKLENCLNYKPKTKIKDGIFKFVEWYKKYYKVN